MSMLRHALWALLLAAGPALAGVESVQVISSLKPRGSVIAGESCNTDRLNVPLRQRVGVLRGATAHVQLRGSALRAPLLRTTVRGCGSCRATIRSQKTRGNRDEIEIDLSVGAGARLGPAALEFRRAGKGGPDFVLELEVIEPAAVTAMNPADRIQLDQVLQVTGRELGRLAIQSNRNNCLTLENQSPTTMRFSNQCAMERSTDTVGVQLKDTRQAAAHCRLTLPQVRLVNPVPAGAKPDLKPLMDGAQLVRSNGSALSLPPSYCSGADLPVNFTCTTTPGSAKDGVPDRTDCIGVGNEKMKLAQLSKWIWGVRNDSDVPVTAPFTVRLAQADGTVIAQQVVSRIEARQQLTFLTRRPQERIVALRTAPGACIQASAEQRRIHGGTTAVPEYAGDPQPLIVEVDTERAVDESNENDNRLSL